MTDTLLQHRWTYLDNNATTRLDPSVLEAMFPFFQGQFVNPSSSYTPGKVTADALRIARRQVQRLIGAAHDREIVFTSGGSESNSTAVISALETQSARKEIITSTVEHASILATCAHLEQTGRAKVHRIPVDRHGGLELDAYRKALSPRTAVASFQWANNETGVTFLVGLLASMAHGRGALFHCDAVQAAGKVPVRVQSADIDMLSLSAHKIHGPKGAGALYVLNGVPFVPLIHGGHQERGRRAGTENSPAITGFGVAAELAMQAQMQEMPRVARLRDRLEAQLLQLVPDSICIGSGSARLPNTLNIAFEDVEADSLLLLLDRARVAASSGSACTSGSTEPSHVLRAMLNPLLFVAG